MSLDKNIGFEQEQSLHFGQRIRDLRQQAGLTLQDVAQATGMSAGLISQIERNLTDPSMRSLRLLSVALDAPIGRFFDEPDESDTCSDRYIVRHNAQRKLVLNKAGMIKHLVTPDAPGVIEGYLVKLEPGASSGEIKYAANGEKFCYVLQGELHVVLDGSPYILKETDSFRIPTHVRHSFANLSSDLCEFLWNIVLLDKK